MKKIVLLYVLLISVAISAQIVTKKCKTCGKPISQCQYKGNHQNLTGNNGGKKTTSWQTKDGAKTWKKVNPGLIIIETTKAVDLGLPSKTIWAGWNIDASSPEEMDGYYAYGEIATKTDYSRNDYVGKWKFKAGDPEADVATHKWGADWCMPTTRQVKELKEKCTWTYYTYNGVGGAAVTGPNGKSIFLPHSGYMYNGKMYNKETGYYYAVGDSDSGGIGFANGYLFLMETTDITTGNNIRAVKVKK